MSGSFGVDLDELDFDKLDGLLPAVVQDATSGRVLMVGFMDRAAAAATLDTGLATFWSRSRGVLWVKGESSGHSLAVRSVEVDCDADTLLLHCDPHGPTCHTGATSCFDSTPTTPTGRPGWRETTPPDAPTGEETTPPDTPTGEETTPPDTPTGEETTPPDTPTGDILHDLDRLIAARDRERPDASYTTSLLLGGTRRIAQKVGEEGVETALAAVAQDDLALTGEAADLMFHLLVLLRSRGLSLTDVEQVLRERHR